MSLRILSDLTGWHKNNYQKENPLQKIKKECGNNELFIEPLALYTAYRGDRDRNAGGEPRSS
jgi:hypothetical protein